LFNFGGKAFFLSDICFIAYHLLNRCLAIVFKIRDLPRWEIIFVPMTAAAGDRGGEIGDQLICDVNDSASAAEVGETQ